MTLTESLLRQIEDPTLTRDGRARLRCQVAADFEHRGQYEAAREALGELWQGIGLRPALEGLGGLAAAEVLLRAGALSGWLGSARQVGDAQDAAKDLISESIARFQALGETTKAAAAQGELGLCYKRAGAYDDARLIYSETLKMLTDGGEKELQAGILLRLAVVESCSGRYSDSLRILIDSAELFQEGDSDALKGRFHNELACALVLSAKAEHRSDYIDRAIIEYTAASHHFERAGHTSYRARAENNLGFLLHTIGHYDDAHEHLNHARRLFVIERDEAGAAQVDETRARVLLAEGKTHEAERVIRQAVRRLEKGDEQSSLAEALTTLGRVLAKRGDFTESIDVLRRAADLAEQIGAMEDAGRALLSLIEAHADRIAEHDLLETYQRADSLLRESQDAETIARLRVCAGRIVCARLPATRPQQRRGPANFWANFNLPERVRAYEARYIRRALIDAGGSVTHAARLLGLNHHAKLAFILKSRHKDLAGLRTPPEKRLKSIMRGRVAARPPRAKARVIRILHVEDNKVAPDVVRDNLTDMGWSVVTCADGAAAAEILAGDEPFDLLIFDHDLPGRSGIELVCHARTLPHRRVVPSVMLSASNIEAEACRAGAAAFLRKPEDVNNLAATVTRLLKKTNSKSRG